MGCGFNPVADDDPGYCPSCRDYLRRERENAERP